jgi:AbiTii
VGKKPSLIDQIEQDALDGEASLAGALRKCVALGGRAGSAELRDWATRELQGYEDGAETPEFRKVRAPILVDGIAGFNRITGQQISTFDLPDFTRGKISDEIALRQGVRELEEMVQSSREQGHAVRLGITGGAELAKLMNAEMNGTTWVERIYWSVSATAVVGILDQIRTRLVALGAELRATSPDPDAPSAAEAANAVNVVINGKARTVNVNAAQSTGSGSLTVHPPSDPERPWWKRTKVIFGLLAGVASIAGLLIAWHPWM